MSFLRPILLLCLFAPWCAPAQTLRMCTDTRPHPPFLMPDGGGSVGELVAAAAREVGMALEYHSIPMARCRAEVGANKVHGFPLTPFDKGIAQFAQYPQRHGAIDPARATAQIRLMVFRRAGERVAWDGRRFTGLHKPVLVIAGAVVVLDRVAAAGAPMDASGKSLKANFDKLLAGRGDLAVGFEQEGALLMADPAYVGMLDMLPQPLSEQVYYLVVSKPFYRQHRQQVEAMWDALGRLRSPARKHIQARPPKRS